MARLVPAAHKPILGFRMQLQTEPLGDAKIYCKSFALPSFDNSPVIAEYGNTQMKIKGKTKWNDLQITCYHYEGMTINDVWNWLLEHQNTPGGEDDFAEYYKHDITLKLLKPDGNTSAHEMKLIGAFISSADMGQFDWASEEIVEISITLAYDYAIKIK